MAEETNPNNPEEASADLSFRAEMWVKDKILGYWKPIVVVLAAIPFVALGWSQFQAAKVHKQESISSAVSKAEEQLSVPIDYIGAVKAGADPSQTFDEANARKVADELVEIAKGGEGAGSIEALLKAAELYRLTGDAALRRSALESAAAASEERTMLFAAESALASMDVEEGNGEAAIARLKKLSQADDYIARRATMALGETQEVLGMHGDAAATYSTFLSRWPDAPENAEVQSMKERAEEKA